MRGLLDLDHLQVRINGYVNLRSSDMLEGETTLRVEARFILVEVMLRGKVPRGAAKQITGLGERTARSLVSQPEEEELVESDSHRSPLRFHIPAKVIEYYFPDLYPEGMI